MKAKFFYLILFIISINCTTPTNNEEFIKKVSGRYLYNSDQIIEVYFKDKILLLTWKGIKDIKPMKFENDIFFVKEMNEKVTFKTNPKNKKLYLVLIPKDKELETRYNYKKLEKDEFTPSEYIAKNEYKKALDAYLAIKQNDSLNVAVNEGELNSLGYHYLRENQMQKALNILKINAELHPNSDNVFDSLGEAYFQSGDTIKAIINYKKSLAINSGNRRAKNVIERFDKK